MNPSPTRRRLLRVALGACGCVACAGGGLLTVSRRADAAEPGHVEGPGYTLSFVGSQREAIMGGKRRGDARWQILPIYCLTQLIVAEWTPSVPQRTITFAS